MLNTVVVAPMQSASVATTIVVKAGLRAQRSQREAEVTRQHAGSSRGGSSIAAPQPERIGDGAEAAQANSNAPQSSPSGVARASRHPLGEPLVAMRLRERAARWREASVAPGGSSRRCAHVAAGVALGASVRASPGKRSVASLSACMPAPVIW